MDKKEKIHRIPDKDMRQIYYLLNSYAIFLEYLIECDSEKLEGVFREHHFYLFRKKLELIAWVFRMMEGG